MLLPLYLAILFSPPFLNNAYTLVTEACNVSGGGRIFYRYRIPLPQDYVSFTNYDKEGDGPPKPCVKAGFPPCPSHEGKAKKKCLYAAGTHQFVNGGWIEVCM